MHGCSPSASTGILAKTRQSSWKLMKVNESNAREDLRTIEFDIGLIRCDSAMLSNSMCIWYIHVLIETHVNCMIFHGLPICTLVQDLKPLGITPLYNKKGISSNHTFHFRVSHLLRIVVLARVLLTQPRHEGGLHRGVRCRPRYHSLLTRYLCTRVPLCITEKIFCTSLPPQYVCNCAYPGAGRVRRCR